MELPISLLPLVQQQTQRSQATLAYEEFAAAPAGATGTEVLDNPTTGEGSVADPCTNVNRKR